LQNLAGAEEKKDGGEDDDLIVTQENQKSVTKTKSYFN